MESFMKVIFILISLVLISCGGGGGSTVNSSPSSTSTPAITGMQGDISAIEPIDLD